ncbi:MAG: deoxynucleoside kinase [Nanoarchaeota archaeon]|nr:deoxynucleoside kinase [Nanoarchaeota archaeon]
MDVKNAYVAVTGNTACGKSNMARLLVGKWGFAHYEERVDKDVLGKFYTDMKSIAIETEVFFITTRAEVLLKLKIMKGLSVTDFAFGVDSKVYALNLLNEGKLAREQYQKILAAENALRPLMPKPDLLIYLRANIDVVQERIKIRGRPEEDSMLTPEGAKYMTGLEQLHEKMFEEHDGPKAIIHTDKLLLVKKEGEKDQIDETLEFIEDCLHKKYEGEAFEFREKN